MPVCAKSVPVSKAATSTYSLSERVLYGARSWIQMIEQIELAPNERALAEKIVFDLLHANLEHKQVIENGENAAALMKSLMKRKAIPEKRLLYFTDADYNTGRGKGSRFERFRDNAGGAEEVLRHPHFLEYLHYFIYGSDLPTPLKQEFLKKAEDQWVKAHELVELTRQLIRRYGLPRYPRNYRLGDTFYQLALDCDCNAGTARAVREAAMRVK